MQAEDEMYLRGSREASQERTTILYAWSGWTCTCFNKFQWCLIFSLHHTLSVLITLCKNQDEHKKIPSTYPLLIQHVLHSAQSIFLHGSWKLFLILPTLYRLRIKHETPKFLAVRSRPPQHLERWIWIRLPKIPLEKIKFRPSFIGLKKKKKSSAYSFQI